jgi:hypothetical protein
MDWMDENRYKAGALMLTVLLLVVAVPYPNNPLYSGGWEVQTSIYEVRQNGIIYGRGTFPWKTEYWGSSSVRYDTDASDAGELGSGYTNWNWDVIGCADTQIDITNPAHLKFDQLTQQWVPATDDEVFYQYSKTITYVEQSTGEEVTEVYFWDHHVYSFWITVISDPDVKHDGLFSIVEAKSAPWTTAGHGVVSSIAPKVLFKVEAWDVGPPSFTLTNEDGSTSTFEALTGTFWTGVMSASVMESYAGLVQKGRLSDAGIDSAAWEDAATPDSGIHASATMSGALNMYYVNNPNVEVQEWDDEYARQNPDAIQGVPTQVLVEFYGELQPGFSWPLGGSISTSAVMYQYRARVDVLVTGGYQLASGQQPEDPVDPTIIDIGGNPLAALLSFLGGGFSSFIIIAFVIIVLYVGYKVIRWMFGGND